MISFVFSFASVTLLGDFFPLTFFIKIIIMDLSTVDFL